MGSTGISESISSGLEALEDDAEEPEDELELFLRCRTVRLRNNLWIEVLRLTAEAGWVGVKSPGELEEWIELMPGWVRMG